MNGTIMGTIVGVSYFLAFQAMGIYVMNRVLHKDTIAFRILVGSVMGSFALQWLPVVTSFLFQFTKRSHAVAFMIALVISLWVGNRFRIKKSDRSKKEGQTLLSVVSPIVFIVLPTFLFFAWLLIEHTIPLKNGALITGQCTYGDMNMHLGFITSIANQGTFPPEYSILPGTKLAYPFLSDSISSSIYIWGAKLSVAYMVPMFFAILQVFFGLYLFALNWLSSKTKATLAFVLFFFTGGFGFLYFMDFLPIASSTFSKIFTEFYSTPTNYNTENIRWSNVIVDMLIPQRATLFGWAVLFPTLAVLYKGIQEKSKKLFVIAGIFAAGLPMIHTHSFMALGMVCFGWLIYQLAVGVFQKGDLHTYENSQHKLGKIVSVGGILFFVVLGYLNGKKVNDIGRFSSKTLMLIAIVGIMCLCIFLLYLLLKTYFKKGIKEVLSTWGIFLGIVVVFGAPQLFLWTFQQVGSGGFVRGIFNWVNVVDFYPWFYIKNIGIVAIAAVPAIFFSKRKDFGVVVPALIIWFVAELIVFTPNVYDNNKLFYVAFMLICIITADWMVEVYRKIKPRFVRIGVGVVIVFLCSFSAVLTMGREKVSEYQLYGADQLALCDYIEENIPAKDIFLTNGRHNNIVAAIAGRNIVCGSDIYLYFHGLDYYQQQADVITMYETPVIDNQKNPLFDKYKVDYILIGPDERASYAKLNEQAIASSFECVFQSNDVMLYRVK